MPGMRIYGELYRAQLERLAADPTAGPTSRVIWNTVEGRAKYDNGSAFRAFLANDEVCVLGNHASAANNIRLHRGASAVLQLVLANNATADGSLSTSLAQISAKIEGYDTGSLPVSAAGTEGRLLFDTTLHRLIYDNASALKTVVSVDSTDTLTNKTLTAPTISTPAITGSSSMTGDVTHTQVTTPSTPAAGFTKIYVKSGNSLTVLGSDGIERNITDTSISDARNFILNGSMDHWQRGTTFTAIANAAAYADRFKYTKVTTSAIHTVSRSTDAPTLAQSGFQSSYSTLIHCTTADAAVVAGDLVCFSYNMEGYDYDAIKGRQLTLSFWVKATKTGIACVNLSNNGTDRSYVAEYTVNTTATWEKKTVTFTINPSGGTDDFTTGIGLRISFTLMAGSTYQTTAGTWNNGNFFATSNQVNHCDVISNDFRIAQIMLNLGSTALAFSRAGLTMGSELASCQRYFWAVPATFRWSAYYDTTTLPIGTIKFPVTMRIAPAVTCNDVTDLRAERPGASTASGTAAFTVSSTSLGSAMIYFTVGSASTVGFGTVAGPNTAANVQINAEL